MLLITLRHRKEKHLCYTALMVDIISHLPHMSAVQKRSLWCFFFFFLITDCVTSRLPIFNSSLIFWCVWVQNPSRDVSLELNFTFPLEICFGVNSLVNCF